MRCLWGTVEQTLLMWTEEEWLEAEEEAWRRCWRQVFGTRPPKDLLPPEPIVLRLSAPRRGRCS
jgi:hypothetical protein